MPLAIAFGEKYRVKGFDINPERIAELCNGIDHTLETDPGQLLKLLQAFTDDHSSSGIFFTDDAQPLADCTVYIITVPTPVDEFKEPDLSLLSEATKTVAAILQKGGLVIYESTVYPGCTEEIGVPILDEISGLRFNIAFFCGFSPARINHGDKSRTIADIRKIKSGYQPAAANKADPL